MPAVQSTYLDTFRPGFAGQIVDTEQFNVFTRVLESGGAAIPFGVPVMRGTLDNTCKLVAAAGILLGISRRDTTLLHADGLDQYEPGENVAIMNYGVMWVIAGGAVTPASVATWNASTGRWVASSTGMLIIPNVRFGTSGGDGDPVRIRLSLDPKAPVIAAA